MDSQDDLSFDGLTNRDRFLDYPEAYADEEGGVHLPTPAFYISWITNRGRILSPPLTGGPLASRNYSFDPVYFLPMDRSPTNDTPKLPGSDPYGQTDVNHPSQQAINEPGQTYDINFNHPDGHVHCSGEPAYGFDAYDIPEPQIQHESADEELVGLGLYDKPDPKPSPSMLLSSGLSGCAEPFHANQFAFESPPEQVPDAIADEGDDTPVANQYNPWSAAPDYPQPYYGLPQRRHAFDDIDATPTGLHAIDGAHIPAVNETARGYPQMYNGYDVKYPYPEDAFVPYNHFNNYPNQYEQLGYGIPY
ncbi:MAG: hypothetical protein M1831_004282 [Alyxoria varia]|nr:MAG: hypothetical protein M1831_004282 [Alyxoria varia]